MEVVKQCCFLFFKDFECKMVLQCCAIRYDTIRYVHCSVPYFTFYFDACMKSWCFPCSSRCIFCSLLSPQKIGRFVSTVFYWPSTRIPTPQKITTSRLARITSDNPRSPNGIKVITQRSRLNSEVNPDKKYPQPWFYRQPTSYGTSYLCVFVLYYCTVVCKLFFCVLWAA